ncbi:Uncharacterized protein GBIM_08544 [Gryllus bimaculatus]|nr:Uncharacterized protein GBIM_08544 [Gryllus bimaculatus]
MKRVHGHLEAKGGTVGDLSSLFRDGSATLRQEKGGVLVLEAAAGLRTLRLKYRHYSARAGPIRVSGVIEAEASPVTLRAQVSLTPPCRAQLRALAVASVGRVRVRATGLGALRRLLPLLERWLQKRLQGDVERSVLQRLEGIVNAHLQRLSC